MTEKDLEEQIDVDDSQDVEEVKKEDVESESEEEMNEKENEEDALEGVDIKAEEGETKETKKSFFGKAKKEKKDKKDIEIEELTDKYKRTMAEFDNFRKRTEKEKAQMYEIGAKEVIEKILPVIDNFERGLLSLNEEEKKNPFADGMDKIYKQLTKTLEDMGVKPIEAVGKEFNPDFHNAVMRGEDEELGENIISEEFQKGYLYHDTVVRHSMVKVVNC
ncbi:MAG: nucleotide exchange factor GrpE [Lachnospiraceae bacterium]|nr:nucleotide exchange factor GrpE [Lachnospiraceae bacterium]